MWLNFNHYIQGHGWFQFPIRQAMACILYSMGLAIATIADLRDVSPETVRKVLQEARQKLELSNLAAVTSAVQVRLTMAMMGLHIDLERKEPKLPEWKY
ncbi:TPA: helix-turn-helix transcriptional regulator [Serratia marcescens]